MKLIDEMQMQKITKKTPKNKQRQKRTRGGQKL